MNWIDCERCGEIVKSRSIWKILPEEINLCGCCHDKLIDFISFNRTMTIKTFFQPERSKREDSSKEEMRCSGHCSNAVREVQ